MLAVLCQARALLVWLQLPTNDIALEMENSKMEDGKWEKPYKLLIERDLLKFHAMDTSGGGSKQRGSC